MFGLCRVDLEARDSAEKIGDGETRPHQQADPVKEHSGHHHRKGKQTKVSPFITTMPTMQGRVRVAGLVSAKI